MLLWKNWNDQLSLIIVFLVPVFVGINYYFKAGVPDVVVGVLASEWARMMYYYYRKAKSEPEPPLPDDNVMAK